MDITRFAIEKNRITAVLLLVIFVAGAGAYNAIPRNEDPGFIIRVALVQTFFPGASPERVEQLVTDKLEKVIQEIPELDYLSSSSKVGTSVIYVNVKESYTEMQPIWDKLRRKIDSARGELPEGVRGPFVNDEFGDVFGTLIALTGEGFSYRELEDIAEEVRDELLLIEDVAKVEINGAQDERVFFEYDNAQLAKFGLSPLQLQLLMQQRNIIQPGGDITTPYEEIVLEPSGNFQTIDELRRAVIDIPGSRQVVRLQDIVEISRGYVEPPDEIMHYNGRPALGLAVSLRQGGNILNMGEQVAQVIERARGVYPIGIELDQVQMQSQIVARKIGDFEGNLLQAVAIVVLVMMLFLGLRTGLIVASLIPATMIAAFLVMSAFDIGLDQMSLASLIIALGMLVDNAIVMSESIMVQMGDGKPAKQAAVDSARELRVPLLVSSLTTAAAFLPIFLSESSTGEYTAPLFKVVTITLLCSWVMALTLIPLLCVLLLRVRPHDAPVEPGAFYRGYRATLLGLLKAPVLTLAAVAVLLLVSLLGLRLVPNIFFPENDRPQFTVEIELPVGSPIERTRSVVEATERFMQEAMLAGEGERGLLDWAAFIGVGAPKFMLSYNPEPPAPHYALILGNATDVDVVSSRIIPALDGYLLAHFPDVNPTVRLLPLGAPAWPPVSIRVSGRDTEEVFHIVAAVKRQLAQIPGVRQISDNWGPRSKKLLIEVDDTRATLAGVSNQDVAISLQTFLDGLETTEFREDDKLIPVVLRSRNARRLGLDDAAALSSLDIYSQATGRSVPLSEVAEPRLAWQPADIQRRNRVRTVSVEALLEPGFTAAQVTAAIAPWLREQAAEWPFGFGWEFGGEVETSVKANQAIADKLPVAALIIVLLLVVQFNSLRRAAIVLITIPLALIGVVVGLLAARSYFGFMTLLGIISLAGIVINNAIVLLDRIQIEIDDNGLDPATAVLRSAQARLRPILLTTATTIGGMLPLWLGGGPMWEPMAISIIFGLAFATVLTLGVVPVLYAVFFRVSFAGRPHGASDHPP